MTRQMIVRSLRQMERIGLQRVREARRALVALGETVITRDRRTHVEAPAARVHWSKVEGVNPKKVMRWRKRMSKVQRAIHRARKVAAK